jgi:hypothetical protein
MSENSALSLGGHFFWAPKAELVKKCQLFSETPSLLSETYQVKASVDRAAFRVFLRSVEGSVFPVTDENVSDLAVLCNEFRFTALAKKVAKYRWMHPEIDAAVRQRLDSIAEEAAKEQRSSSRNAMKFGPSDSAPLNGIIAFLTSHFRGNVHDLNIVSVTASAPRTGDNPAYAAKNAADLTADSYFWSTSKPKFSNILAGRNNWICYDFRAWKVIPTHYSVRSRYDGGVNAANLLSWLVETSMDGEEWSVIDQRVNNDELNRKNITKVFSVARSEMCRMIKLVNFGRNHLGDDCLLISAWEIFGSLID